MGDLGIGEIISLIIGAVGTGSGIYGLATRPGVPKATPPIVTPEDAMKTSKNQQASLANQFPSIQAATGGALSPEAWIQLSQLLTGKAGDPSFGAAGQDLLQKISSGSGLTPTGSTFG
jgi:hypothetical protein